MNTIVLRRPKGYNSLPIGENQPYLCQLTCDMTCALSSAIIKGGIANNFLFVNATLPLKILMELSYYSFI